MPRLQRSPSSRVTSRWWSPWAIRGMGPSQGRSGRETRLPFEPLDCSECSRSPEWKVGRRLDVEKRDRRAPVTFDLARVLISELRNRDQSVLRQCSLEQVLTG